MKKTKLKVSKEQVARLTEMLAAQDNVIREAKDFSKLLKEGKPNHILSEGLLDSLQKVMQNGGFPALKRAVLTAVAAGSLMGVSAPALAQAAQKAGATPEQAKEIGMAVQQGSNSSTANPKSAEFAQELTKLNQRYVVADGSDQKDFMKFTGNINDVVGIEPKNGYPIFAKGSESEQRLKAAFANPQVVTGIVNVRGKDFPGKFVKNDGLYYTYAETSAPASIDPKTDAPSSPAASGGDALPTAKDNTEMIDFTGIFQQAQLRYKQYAKPDGTVTDFGKTFSNFQSYVPEFLRRNDPGFQGMSDQAIGDMFAGGLKAKVEKGKFKMGGVSRPNLNARR